MQTIICFISDFGLDDAWVGVCHAVIHQACPQARIVNMSHMVPPYDTRKGAVVAAASAWQLPDAIHLVVVDPTVGSERSDLCIVTERGTRLVGPDNGVLIPAAWRTGGVAEAFAIEPPQMERRAPLPTFHARDVLGPAAAALACGVEPKELGRAMDPSALVDAPFSRSRRESGHVVAEVLDVDRFGSVRVGITDEEADEYEIRGKHIELSFGHRMIEAPFVSAFSQVPEGEPVALIDSSGWLTLAVRQGSASERYGIEPGDVARVRIIE